MYHSLKSVRPFFLLLLLFAEHLCEDDPKFQGIYYLYVQCTR